MIHVSAMRSCELQLKSIRDRYKESAWVQGVKALKGVLLRCLALERTSEIWVRVYGSLSNFWGEFEASQRKPDDIVSKEMSEVSTFSPRQPKLLNLFSELLRIASISLESKDQNHFLKAKSITFLSQAML